MWIVSISLMASWMVCVLLGLGRFGVTHLIVVAAIAIELIHRPAPRAQRPVAG